MINYWQTFLLTGNLLENADLRAQNGWDGNNCNQIDFYPWEVLENGGDGVQLEKSPNGSSILTSL